MKSKSFESTQEFEKSLSGRAKRLVAGSLLAASAFGLAGCGDNSEATPVPTSSPSVSETFEPTPDPTSSSEPTETPEPTPTNGETETPNTSEIPPIPEGLSDIELAEFWANDIRNAWSNEGVHEGVRDEYLQWAIDSNTGFGAEIMAEYSRMIADQIAPSYIDTYLVSDWESNPELAEWVESMTQLNANRINNNLIALAGDNGIYFSPKQTAFEVKLAEIDEVSGERLVQFYSEDSEPNKNGDQLGGVEEIRTVIENGQEKLSGFKSIEIVRIQ